MMRSLSIVLALAVILAAGVFAAPYATDAYRARYPEPVFDRNTAFVLAGMAVPQEIEGFYFFVLDSEQPAEEVAVEMAGYMLKASDEQDYLGVIGPDPARNLSILQTAFDSVGSELLSGMKLVYVGPPEQRETVVAAMQPHGGKTKFVAYP